MADPIKPGAMNKAPSAAPPEPAPQPSKQNPDEKLVAENESLKKQIEESRARDQRLNHSIRKLSAAILTPAGIADKGQARRNGIAAAIAELVKEFEFKDDQ